MPKRPAGAVDLGPVKARLAAFRAARGKRSSLSDQDVRVDLYEYNHAHTAGPAGTEPPPETAS